MNAPHLTVVEWHAWKRFLISHVVPDAMCLPVTPGATLADAGGPPGATLLHVNLTRPGAVFPDFDAWLSARAAAGWPVLNGYCRSIDKWAVQAACVAAGLPAVRATRDGDDREPLIVKARANYSGMYEGLLPPGLAGDLAPPLWPYPERVHRLTRGAVPADMWEDPAIAIERFVSNRAGRFQRAYVAGDYAAVATSVSPVLVKQMDQRRIVDFASDRDAASRPPANRDPLSVACRLARAMRADFAAIDLALDEDGVPHPIDLNTTPSWGTAPDLNPRLVGDLQAAFEPLIERGSSYGVP